MSKLPMAIGVCDILLGMLIAAAPQLLLSLMDLESRQGRYIWAAFRFTVGLVLILAAPSSKIPMEFQIIGTLAFLGGLAILLIPNDLWSGVIQWWTTDHVTFLRVSATAVFLLGVFIAYTVLTGNQNQVRNTETTSRS